MARNRSQGSWWALGASKGPAEQGPLRSNSAWVKFAANDFGSEVHYLQARSRGFRRGRTVFFCLGGGGGDCANIRVSLEQPPLVCKTCCLHQWQLRRGATLGGPRGLVAQVWYRLTPSGGVRQRQGATRVRMQHLCMCKGIGSWPQEAHALSWPAPVGMGACVLYILRWRGGVARIVF